MTLLALARLPARRLLGERRAWIALAGWTLATLVLSALRGRDGTSATNALLGIYAPVTLPLLTLALTSAVVRGGKLQAASSSLTRVGASGVLAALAHVAVAVLGCLVAGAALGVAVSVIAHGSADPSLGRDVATCAWVGALSGAAYASLFSFGSSFGPSGSGRGAILILNWILGGGALGAVLPSAHVRSLLGGDPAGALGQRSSALALLGITIVASALCAWRGRRPE